MKIPTAAKTTKLNPETTTKTALNTVKAVGVIATAVSVVATGYDANRKGFQDKHMIDLLAVGIAALPVIGQAWGAIWFVANAISVIETGKSISENIQASAYGNNQENAHW